MSETKAALRATIITLEKEIENLNDQLINCENDRDYYEDQAANPDCEECEECDD